MAVCSYCIITTACAGFREALTATAEDLLSMNVIPVFNENDAILSAMPLLVPFDLLVHCLKPVALTVSPLALQQAGSCTASCGGAHMWRKSGWNLLRSGPRVRQGVASQRALQLQRLTHCASRA